VKELTARFIPAVSNKVVEIMGLLNKFTFALEKIGMGFLIAGYGTMTVVALIEVLRRYFFGLSFNWSEELVRFLLIATTFIGGAVAYKKGSLVLFDVLLNRLTKKKSLILSVINHSIILIFMIFLTKLGLDYIMQPSVMLQSSPGLGLGMMIPYAFLPIGFIMIILFCIEYILTGIRDIYKEGGIAQ